MLGRNIPHKAMWSNHSSKQHKSLLELHQSHAFVELVKVPPIKRFNLIIIGVRGRGSWGAAAPPGLKNSGHTLFSGQAEVAKKSWMQKVYSTQWKISGHTLFSGQAQVVKNTESQKYIQYSENFQGNSIFYRASTSCSKIVNGKKFFNTVCIHLGGSV